MNQPEPSWATGYPGGTAATRDLPTIGFIRSACRCDVAYLYRHSPIPTGPGR